MTEVEYSKLYIYGPAEDELLSCKPVGSHIPREGEKLAVSDHREDPRIDKRLRVSAVETEFRRQSSAVGGKDVLLTQLVYVMTEEIEDD